MNFGLSFGSKVLNSVSPIQSGSNLLISLNKSLEFDIEVFILASEDVAVGLNSVYLGLEVTVSLHHVVIRESKVFLLLSGNDELILGVSESVLSLKYLGGEISVSGVLTFSLSLEVSLLGELAVEVSLERLGLNHKSGVIVLGSHELSLSILKSFMSSSKFEVLSISQFGEFVCLL